MKGFSKSTVVVGEVRSMDEFDAAEVVKRWWLEHRDSILLRSTVLASCPFCGKGDRISLLPPAQETSDVLDETYSVAWGVLANPNRAPGICGFCLNVVLISETGAAMPGIE